MEYQIRLFKGPDEIKVLNVYATNDSVAASRAAEALMEDNKAEYVFVEVTSIPRRDAFFYAEKP